MARTPLGIVAAVCNRGICPHVTFLPRLQATLLVGDGHHMNRGYNGSRPLLQYPRPLCKAVDEKVSTMCPRRGFAAHTRQLNGILIAGIPRFFSSVLLTTGRTR